MDCTTCKEHRAAEPVPYIVHESAMARSERHIKRLLVALIISLLVNLAIVGSFLYVWQLYDYTSEETIVDVDAKDGNANYIGRDGSIVNGEDSR